MNAVISLFAGIIFGLGLALSGMVNPAKVIGFLDLFGAWDPTLAFVMGGALLITLPSFRLVLKRRQPLFAPSFNLPAKRLVEGRLVLGAVLFGIGWGIGGFCPGPAVTSLVTLRPEVLVFMAAMIAGMLIHDLLLRLKLSAAGVADAPKPSMPEAAQG